MDWFDRLTEDEQNELTYLLEQAHNLIDASNGMTGDAYDEYTKGRLYNGIYDVMLKAKLWG